MEKAAIIAENYHMIPSKHLNKCLECDYLVFIENMKSEKTSSVESDLAVQMEDMKRHFKITQDKSEERIMSMMRDMLNSKFKQIDKEPKEKEPKPKPSFHLEVEAPREDKPEGGELISLFKKQST
jgi:hypothetical protein